MYDFFLTELTIIYAAFNEKNYVVLDFYLNVLI